MREDLVPLVQMFLNDVDISQFLRGARDGCFFGFFIV